MTTYLVKLKTTFVIMIPIDAVCPTEAADAAIQEAIDDLGAHFTEGLNKKSFAVVEIRKKE